MKRSKKLKFIALPFGFLLLLILFFNKQLKSQVVGAIKYRKGIEMSAGNIGTPSKRDLQWKDESAFANRIYKSIADRPITEEMLAKKGYTIRILLARLMLKQNVDEVNQILQKLTVWGNCGSSWALNPKGDYDFPLTILTTILWKFGEHPDIIYPETKKHLLDVVLSEDGGKFSYTAPKTLGLVTDTENHMLMTEGSRYLKNRWIRLHGNEDAYFNNEENGMEEKLLSLLGEMKQNGLYEFNSVPYLGYTITALLNLEAFASEKVSADARAVLDYLNWSYAINSYKLNHYPPMRRRYEKAAIQDLQVDYHTAFMKSWLSFSDFQDYEQSIGVGKEHALMGACMPYRPADKVVEMLFHKKDGYFIKQGHGPGASPEISSAGKNFLISAGGVNRGKRSLIVARPICLFLNDNSDHLSEIIHLAGPGDDFMGWNNTGVYKNFACAAGPVSIPRGMAPEAQKGNWSVYSVAVNTTVVAYSSEKLGLIAVFEDIEPVSIFKEVMKANSAPEELNHSFMFPNGKSLTYDVLSKKDQWVMISGDGKVMDRDFDSWPLIEGEL
ncbi:hypothetical protein R9C00_12635 [Flammeovirgaceae bacterium SG7u.111]|nr:hypothetical protein [Flammeovirgaceae bacterium SG7u.132]WPO38300.1 hypothetical protein R9C00_12635 [Flammeovirgaceae bacterium SG7u.111]